MDNLAECAFEPDVMEIRCVDCGKRTGETGTCEDVGFCTTCRTSYVQSGIAQGMTPAESETSFAEMLIGMIEGRGYQARFKPSRVLHLSCHGSPYCGIKGGPHPLTEDINQSNCKRCLKAVANEGSKPKR